MICLQGVSDQEKTRWQDTLDKYIRGEELQHRSLHSQHNQELFTMIYIRESILPRVRKVNDSAVKLNMLNKQGAIAVSLSIDDTDLCLINCLLDSGQKDTSSRLNQLRCIHEQAFHKDSTIPQPTIPKHHYRLLMGQLNLKIRLPDYEVRQYLDSYKA